ncbi:MAG: hypothetical protein KF757_08150 [Phycisphaeraceae bacterium]|nr:hypothetical protein [Phycisphaeraceae bacterium]MCW5762727.1 hypothetical protein [Phycisphaeraceae bacterium]
MRFALALCSATVLALTATTAAAQPFLIDYASIDAGASRLTGGSFELIGSIGQPDASTAALAGGMYTLDTGFLAVIRFEASCNPADLAVPYGTLDFFDVQLFLNFYSNGNLLADLNGDGLLDFFDVQAFLNHYAAGCP